MLGLGWDQVDVAGGLRAFAMLRETGPDGRFWCGQQGAASGQPQSAPRGFSSIVVAGPE